MTSRAGFGGKGLAVAVALGVVAMAVVLLARRGAPGPTRDGGAVARRVVSLSPSTTEALFAIGAGDAVVGRSRYCDYPPAASALPQVGGYVDASLEAILALRPDLATGARGPAGAALVDKLASRGIPSFFPPTESLAQIDAMMAGLGERTGHAEDARTVVEGMHRRLDAVAAALEGAPRPRVLLVFGLEPVVAAGPQGFADEMVRRAGAENAVKEGTAYPVLSLERVLALDPDVIVNAAVAESHGENRIRRDTPGWKEARAVREGRVIALTDERVLRPGPRVVEGIAVLARALHPDVALP